MDNTQLQKGFWIADWQVRPKFTELERDGKIIQLEPKVMELLIMLASKPGEVFSRTDLENNIWQGTIVGYNSLSKAITKLREALGDDIKNPQYIQTISKKGYRLIAEVRQDPVDTAPPDENTTILPSDISKSGSFLKRQAIVGSTIAVFALIALFLMKMQINNPKSDIANSGAESVTAPASIKPANVDNNFSIVVLPFRNISANENDAYLADGITSDLITNLSRLSGIFVTASSVDLDPEKVKKEFSARYMLSGDVAKIGQDIRINVRLSDVIKGSILWANRYERKFTDLFAIQDEVTQKIVQALELRLTEEEKQRIARRYTSNLQAYEYFLRAQYYLSARTQEDNIRAREMYQQAIEIDPGFARAYAGMAISYTVGYIRSWPAEIENPLDKALELSNRAIKLSGDLPESNWVAGFVNGNLGNYEKATFYLEKTLTLNPNYADAYAMLAWINIYRGKPELAIDDITKALKLNPTSGYLYKMQLGKAHFFLGNYDQALAQFEYARQGNPAFIDTLLYTAVTYVNLNRYEDAAWIITEARNYNPDFDLESWWQRLAIRDEKIRAKLHGDIALLKQYLEQQRGKNN